ncbi:MAG TPA: glycosyltransferase family 39 protein [Candidatus Didemnitutus sp.]|nr:glycosyltransferase family 39 protein [Candidatus Didemnitutus sp.]
MAATPTSPTSTATEIGRVGSDLLILIALSALLFGLRLGTAPLANPDEGRYAEIPREMLARNDWVTPHLDGVNYFEKPPLVYWVTAASIRTFGQAEWAVRIVPAAFALVGVLLTFAATRRLYGRTAGLAAAIVLATSLLYFALARIVVLDMAVSVLMSAALFAFILGLREPAGMRRRLLFYGLYASMALATLTKGLIGFMVTGAIMFLWLLVFNQWKRLRPMYLPTGAILFLAIALPWHLMAARANPTWVHRYLVYEHWERFTSPAAGRPGAWWYFVPVLILGLFPWTGFLTSAVRESLRGGWSARKRNAEGWFFVVWAGFVFAFFSASHSKLVTYILPIFPALAVLIGTRLAAMWQGRKRQLDTGLLVFTISSVVLAAALSMAVLRPEWLHLPEETKTLQPYAFAMAGIALAGGAAAHHLAERVGARSAIVTVALTAVGFYSVLTFVIGAVERPGTKELALIVKAKAKPGDEIVHYHEFFHDFTYYAETVVDVVSGKGELEVEEDPEAQKSGRFMDDAEFMKRWAGPKRLWVVTNKKDAKAQALLEDSSFHYNLIGETRGHTLISNQP